MDCAVASRRWQRDDSSRVSVAGRDPRAAEGDGSAASGLTADATLHERGVPYHMGDSEGDYFTIGGGVDGKVVTLTIAGQGTASGV
jgi:hypothetical protein